MRNSLLCFYQGREFNYKTKTWKTTSKGPDLPYMSYNEYKNAAKDLMSSSGDNILTYTSKERSIFKFNKESGYFGIANKDGDITTFYKPEKGENYFKEQIEKYGGQTEGAK